MTSPNLSAYECDDCASTVRHEWPEPKVMDVLVDHSPTCPAWRLTDPEIIVRLLPKGLTDEQVHAYGAPIREQEARR